MATSEDTAGTSSIASSELSSEGMSTNASKWKGTALTLSPAQREPRFVFDWLEYR